MAQLHKVDFTTRRQPAAPGAPHSTAQRVVELLGDSVPLGGLSLAAIRRHYNVSRRQFLGELKAVEDIIHICPSEPGVPRLTIIRPRGYRVGQHYPALVYLHGGGWTLGSLATYEVFCRQLANEAGAIIVWVEYRLAPEHPFPAAYDDTLAAWRWIHANLDKIGADPARVAIGGDSAGGNLAAAASLVLRNPGEIKPWKQILLYPCLDLTASLPSHQKFAEGYLLTAPIYAWYRANYAGGAALLDPRLSPLHADDLSALPPTLLLYAGFDPLRDEAAAYAMKLALADVAVETVYFPDMIHGFLTMGGVIPAANYAIGCIAAAILDGCQKEADK